MQTHLLKQKRNLLLVCSHLPESTDLESRMRAWQLLTIAQKTHRVFLACRLDGGLRLAHWRELARRTEKMAIVPGGYGKRASRMRQEIAPWIAQHRFDAVLCDTAELWSAVEDVQASRLACGVSASIQYRLRRRLTATLPSEVLRLDGEASLLELAARLRIGERSTQPLEMHIDPELPLAQAA